MKLKMRFDSQLSAVQYFAHRSHSSTCTQRVAFVFVHFVLMLLTIITSLFIAVHVS